MGRFTNPRTLINPGRMDRLITLLVPYRGPDELAEPAPQTYLELAVNSDGRTTIPADFEETLDNSGKDIKDAKRFGMRGGRILLRWITGMEPTWKVRYDNRIWEILYINEVGRRRRILLVVQTLEQPEVTIYRVTPDGTYRVTPEGGERIV